MNASFAHGPFPLAALVVSLLGAPSQPLAHRTIVGTGDWRLEGGVTPTIRVPLTADTVRARVKDGHDVVLETAIRTLAGL